MKKLLYILILINSTFFHAQVWNKIGNTLTGNSVRNGFGIDLEINNEGNRVAIGIPFDNQNGFESGLVRVYEKNVNGEWIQIGSDIYGDFIEDLFGYGISLNSSGNILAVAAKENDSNGDRSGQAKIFKLENNEWIQLGANINGLEAFDFLGKVSLNGDGNTVAVGQQGNLSGRNDDYGDGLVRVFQYQNEQWIQKGNNLRIDGSSNRFFGSKIHMDNTGNNICVSYTNVDTRIQYVQVFTYTSDIWVKKGQPTSLTQLSGSFRMNSLGNIYVLGDRKTSTVKVFEYSSAIDTWEIMGDPIQDTESLSFGVGVDINDVGDRIVVGDVDNDGSVKVYVWNGTNWEQQGEEVVAPTNELTGFSVSINGQGNIFTSARFNGTTSGFAQIFELNENNLSTNEFAHQVSNFSFQKKEGTYIFSSKEIKSISVYNINGNLILSNKSAVNKNKIHVATLTNGVYIFLFESNIGKSYFKKILVE